VHVKNIKYFAVATPSGQ